MASGPCAGSSADACAAAVFQKGDRVHLRPVAHGWRAETFMVIALVSHGGWPHYELRAPDDSTWIASQLELSPSPLWDGSENSRPRRLRRSRAAAKATEKQTPEEKAPEESTAEEKAAGPAPATPVAPVARDV